MDGRLRHLMVVVNRRSRRVVFEGECCCAGGARGVLGTAAGRIRHGASARDDTCPAWLSRHIARGHLTKGNGGTPEFS